MPNVMPESLADQIIAEKIREWELRRKKTKEAEQSAKEIKTHPFLTISRDYGCGEEIIIPQLEKTLGWKIYGRNLLDHIAKRESLSRTFIETLDEQRQVLVDGWVNYLIRSGTVLQKDYVLKISRLVQVIVCQESAIFLGRGTNYILQDKKEGLRLRLAAPFAHRVQNIMKLKNVSEKEAKQRVVETDKQRMHYVNDYFNQDINDCAGYDIVLNTMTTDCDTICKLIVQLMEMKKAKA